MNSRNQAPASKSKNRFVKTVAEPDVSARPMQNSSRATPQRAIAAKRPSHGQQRDNAPPVVSSGYSPLPRPGLGVTEAAWAARQTEPETEVCQVSSEASEKPSDFSARLNAGGPSLLMTTTEISLLPWRKRGAIFNRDVFFQFPEVEMEFATRVPLTWTSPLVMHRHESKATAGFSDSAKERRKVPVNSKPL